MSKASETKPGVWASLKRILDTLDEIKKDRECLGTDN